MSTKDKWHLEPMRRPAPYLREEIDDLFRMIVEEPDWQSDAITIRIGRHELKRLVVKALEAHK